ncbi:MAG: zinc ribbon domain-containing protein [Candidatus Alcyoniella australis]|nr:zinc ribbon domain-containing protein [Candidatus Alcyoniella australis]
MICPICGWKVSDAAPACPSCGTLINGAKLKAIRRAAEQELPEPKQKRSDRLGSSSVAVLLTLVFSVLGLGILAFTYLPR